MRACWFNVLGMLWVWNELVHVKRLVPILECSYYLINVNIIVVIVIAGFIFILCGGGETEVEIQNLQRKVFFKSWERLGRRNNRVRIIWKKYVYYSVYQNLLVISNSEVFLGQARKANSPVPWRPHFEMIVITIKLVLRQSNEPGMPVIQGFSMSWSYFFFIPLIYGNPNVCSEYSIKLVWSNPFKKFQPFSSIGCTHRRGRLEVGGRTRGECFGIGGHYSLCHILVPLKLLTCI